ncbi:MAG: hypothetical protein WCI57_03935 [Candidatus Berkelbacteria bacterium]
MTEISSFTIVCSRESRHYLFRAIFTDEVGNIKIVGLPAELSDSEACWEDSCTEDVFFASRQIHVATNNEYLTFDVVGYDFREIEYDSRVSKSQ